MKRITAVKILDRYCVWLRFDDGTEGSVDFSPWVGKGVFQAWKDYHVFEGAFISSNGRVLEWPGDLDFCADSLFLRVSAKTPEEIFPNLSHLHSHA